MSRLCCRGERGAATGIALGVAALVLFLAVGAVMAARVLLAHRMAGSVADLGALAGAVAVQHGHDGCRAAREQVERSGVVAVDCRVSDARVRLVVRVELGRLLGRDVAVSARAHAGPR